MVYFPYRSPFILRSLLVRFSIASRSVLDRFSIDSRSSFVHPPFILRSGIEDWSKNERRIIGGKTEMYRNSNGKPREGDPNKNFIFNRLNLNYYGKTYSRLHHFSAPSHSVYWKSMSFVKLMGFKVAHWRSQENSELEEQYPKFLALRLRTDDMWKELSREKSCIFLCFWGASEFSLVIKHHEYRVCVYVRTCIYRGKNPKNVRSVRSTWLFLPNFAWLMRQKSRS